MSDSQGGPINGIRVFVETGPNRGSATTTASDGTYLFVGFEPGAYELIFSREGYNIRFARFELCPEESALVNPIMLSHQTMLDVRVFGKVMSLSSAASGVYSFNISDPTKPDSILCL